MVTKVISVCVDEGLVRFISVFGLVVTLTESFGDLMRDIKEPETHRQEHQLDEVSQEEHIVGQKIGCQKLRP